MKKKSLFGVLLCIPLSLVSCGKENQIFSAGGMDVSGNDNGTQIQETAQRTFVPENCSILYYKAKND